jgi:hypothetical protein
MIASFSIVLVGNLNPVFSSLRMQQGFLCLLIFPHQERTGRLVDKEIFCLLLNFPWKFRRQKRYLITFYWRAVPHRKSSAQLWTVSDDTVPHIYERSLCQFLFRNLEHFNCGIKFGLCVCLKRMNTGMCFCACVYMKSVHPTIVTQSNSIQIRPTDHARYPRWS